MAILQQVKQLNYMQAMKAPGKYSIWNVNKSFYLPGKPINYSVSVTDKDDTAKIDPANLFVSVDYVRGFDKASLQ